MNFIIAAIVCISGHLNFFNDMQVKVILGSTQSSLPVVSHICQPDHLSYKWGVKIHGW